MTPTHPARRPDIEAWLDSLGCTWTFDPDLRLDRVDQVASLANQARHEALNAEVVERYTADMARGDQFPPLLVHTGGDPLALIGGNHRYAAHTNLRHSTAAAYLVDAPDAVIVRLRFEDNRRHGLPPTMAERIDHAVALMQLGISQGDAAAIVGVPQPKLSVAAACIRAGERARHLGVDDGYHRLPEPTRYQLSQLDSDEVFTAAADLAANAALPTKTVSALVRACRAVDDFEALRLIGAEAEDHADRAADHSGNVRAGRTARSRLDGALAEIRGLDPDDIVDTCPNDDVRAVLAQRIMETAKVLYAAHELLTGRRSDAA